MQTPVLGRAGKAVARLQHTHASNWRVVLVVRLSWLASHVPLQAGSIPNLDCPIIGASNEESMVRRDCHPRYLGAMTGQVGNQCDLRALGRNISEWISQSSGIPFADWAIVNLWSKVGCRIAIVFLIYGFQEVVNTRVL
jgi:hypothetical protein